MFAAPLSGVTMLEGEEGTGKERRKQDIDGLVKQITFIRFFGWGFFPVRTIGKLGMRFRF
jgi:hypothetical protein